MKKLALLASLLLTLAVSAFAGPYDLLWTNFKVLSVTPTTATTAIAAQNNFPLLVRFNNSNPANGSDILAGSLTTGGLDVRFTDSAGNALTFEIERWNAAKDSAEFWVLLPQLKGSGATTKIRVYYGKTGEANLSNSRAVFDTANGFRAVWHMNGASSTSDELDATYNGLDATVYGTPAPINLGGLGSARSLSAAPMAFTIGKTQTNRGVFFTSANIGYSVGLSGLALKTTDGGVNWNASKTGVLTSQISLNAIACPTADTCYAVGGSGVSGSGTSRFITRTTNSGGTWAKQSATDSAASSLTYFGVSCLSSNTCLAVGGNYGTSRYYATLKASTGAWSLPTTTTTSHINAVSCVAGGNCYGAGGSSSSTRVTTRFAPLTDSTWTITTQDSVASSGLLNAIHCTTNDLCYAVGQNGVVVKTTNASTTGTWTVLASGLTNNLRSIHCANDNTCWAVGNATAPAGNTSPILKTTNGGTSWVSQNVAAFADSLYSVRFSDANTGVIVGANGTVLRTTNGGTTWALNGSSRKLAYATNGSYSFATGTSGTGVGDNYTTSAWVNPSTASNSQMTVIGKGDNHWNFQIRSSKFEATDVNYFNNQVATNPPYGNIYYQNGTQAANFTAGWHHVVGVRVSNTELGTVTAAIESLYVDGGPKSGGTSLGALNTGTSAASGSAQRYLDAVSIGRQTDAYQRHWTLGPIDEVRSEGVRRSGDWVALSYQTQKPNPTIFSQGAAVSTAIPVGLNYSSNTATYTFETAITPNTPSLVSGGANAWSSTPTLPAGLSLDPLSGVISGTPTVSAATATYTITASNQNGSTNKAISITIPAPGVPALTYTGSPYSLTATRSAGIIAPANASDTVTSCSFSPALSAGLSFNNRCVITGTPTASKTSTDYTVTATNVAGSSTAHVFITVIDTLATVSSQPVAKNAILNASGIKFGVSVTNGGSAALTYKWIRKYRAGGAEDTIRVVASSAALTDTLTLPSDSVFTGADSTTYKVQITNAAGSIISNTVLLRIVPSVSYSLATQVLGKVSTTLTPTTTSNITACASSPTLPAGLSIAATTCIITGTPTTGSAAADYSITPTGLGGVGTAFVLNLAVQNTPVGSITYAPDTASYEQGLAIASNIPNFSTFVAPATFAVTTGALPAGLSINSSTGIISGTPTGTGTSVLTVTVTNATASTTRDLSLTVYATESYSGSFADFKLNTTTAGAGITSAQTKFPVLIRLTTAHRAIFQASDSSNIRFANGSGAHLPYQIDSWSKAPGDTAAAIWVLADNVSASGITTVRMYYNQSSGVSRSNGALVFGKDNGFRSVWHLGNTSTTALRTNSVGGAPAAKPNNIVAPGQAGVIGLADTLSGGNGANLTGSFFRLADTTSMDTAYFADFTGGMTYSVWSSIRAAANPVQTKLNTYVRFFSGAAGTATNNPPADLAFGRRDNTSIIQFETRNATANLGTIQSNTTALDTASGAWQLMTVTLGSGTTPAVRMFVNGALVGSGNMTGSTINTPRRRMFIGKTSWTDSCFKGLLDDAVLSNVARSDDWVKLTYKNQKPGATPIANLTYTTLSPVYTQGVAITANVAAILGSATRYDVSPALPLGLTLNAASGNITGTPSVAAASTAYTITAYGDSVWSTTASLNLTVNASVTAPTNLVYAPDSLGFKKDIAIAAWTPTVTGTVTTWSINPALPAGLVFSTSTGAITGTPTVTTAFSGSFTVTAANGTGSTTKVIKMTISVPVAILPDAFVIRVNGQAKPYAFQIPAGSTTEKLTLSIIDAWGRTIWVKSINPAKDKLTEISWNGKSANGRQASAGMYVVRITVLNAGKTTNFVRKSVSLKPR